jgi:hypothetical protein
MDANVNGSAGLTRNRAHVMSLPRPTARNAPMARPRATCRWALSDDEPEHIGRACADGHPDSDFTASLTDGE